MRGLEAVNEVKIWHQAGNALDPLYKDAIGLCRRAQTLKDYDRLRRVLRSWQGVEPPTDLQALAAINCRDEVEKVVSGVYSKQYAQLFSCKLACQTNHPHSTKFPVA